MNASLDRKPRLDRPQQARVARQKTRQLDAVLATVQMPPRPRGGWVATIRQALGMSPTQLAKRLGITRQSVDQLETNERKATVTLASVQRAAEALGCDLQYVLIPRQRLVDTVADQARQRARHRLARVNQSQALEASALDTEAFAEAVADLAQELAVQRPADLWND